MKKKGFTLIELLAVIVILAIIALIATPIIMNVIQNSKKGAAERSAENYMNAVETVVGTERIEGNILEGEYTIQEDGNLCEGTNVTNCEKPIKIYMSGNKPTSGTIVIENGLVVSKSLVTEISTTMEIGDYTVGYNSNGELEATENNKTDSDDNIKIEKIIIEYPTAYYESKEETVYNAMTEYKEYEPEITIEPSNASNKNLKFEISYSYLSTDVIDETTGIVTHSEPTSNGFGNCGHIKVKASALDGSGITTEITIDSKLSDPSSCNVFSPWH